MLSEYCKKHTGYEYCEKVNMKVPSMFCVVCKGEWEKWRKEDIGEHRKSNRRPLTNEQKANKDLVSVVIPVRQPDIQYLKRTVDSVRTNATGSIEVIVVLDGCNADVDDAVVLQFDNVIGQRKAMNRAVEIANGEYLLRLDGHCALSPEWDARMKSSCGETDLVGIPFDHLDEKTWKGKGIDVSFWYLDAGLKPHSVRPWKRLQDRQVEEDLMSIAGGAWMIRKDYYDKLGGSEESLGGHGGIGPEWSLKVWLTGGRVLLRTDVVCCHLFRARVPFPVDQSAREMVFKKLYRKWVLGEDPRRTRPIEWLLYKFNNYVKGRTLEKLKLKDCPEVVEADLSGYEPLSDGLTILKRGN